MLPAQNFYMQELWSDGSKTFIALISMTSSLVLRRPTDDDQDDLNDVLADEENTKDDLSVQQMSKEDRSKMIVSWLTEASPLTNFQFAVSINGKVIGIAGYGWIGVTEAPAQDGSGGETQVEKQLQTGALGVVINPSCRGKGYAYEALRMAIDYGFRSLKLQQINLGTTSRNQAMRGLLERKFGIAATVTPPDRFGNDLEWNILPEDWEEWLRARQ